MKNPPKLPLKIFRLFCSKKRLEELEGDLYEEFQDNLENKGHQKAKRIYFWTILMSFRSYIFDASKSRTSNRLALLKHYFQMTFRGLVRNKVNSFVNLISLSIGFASTIAITVFILNQLTLDDFLPNQDRIVRLEAKNPQWGQTEFNPFVHPALGPVLQQNLPEIEAFCRFQRYSTKIKIPSQNHRSFVSIDVLKADSTFFKFYPFQLVSGSIHQTFSGPSNIILTESAAQKLFGEKRPIGEVIPINDGRAKEYKVSAIIKDLPKNSSLQFDVILSVNINYGLNSRGYSPYPTYLLLKPGAELSSVQQKINPTLKSRTDNKSITAQEYQLTPFKDLKYATANPDKLTETMSKEVLLMFATIAALILILSVINYVNLAVANALRKGQEAGIRKIIGAGRGSYFLQFLIDSITFCLIALPIALLIAKLSIPYFESVLGKTMHFNFLNNLQLMITIFSVVILIGLAAGIYPALVVSRFSLSNFLKGKLTGSVKGAWLRKGMIVLQFTASFILILGSVMVQRQLHFIQNQKLGYNPSELLVIDYSISSKFKLIKSGLNAIPEVLKVSITTSPPGGNVLYMKSTSKISKQNIDWHEIDQDYIEILGLNIIEGRGFRKENTQAEENSIMINQSMAALIRSELSLKPTDPLPLSYQPNPSDTRNIIGIVEDFQINSLHEKIQPMIFGLSEFGGRTGARFLIQVSTQNIPETMKKIEDIWQKFQPNSALNIKFMDDRIEQLYTDEMKLGKVFGIFTAIAIGISCLGLFGFISFLTEVKTKEIGVRKVLGASMTQLILLLTKEVYALIFIACIIGLPIAYYGIQNWLDNFAYHVEISFPLIFIAFISALAISAFTMILKTYKAAKTNPVDSLRNE